MAVAPKALTDLIPHAYGWSQPRFASIENGLVFYKTCGWSNAGGSSHTISFPVNIRRKNLSAEDQWENLAGNAVQAVKNRSARQSRFTSGH